MNYVTPDFFASDEFDVDGKLTIDFVGNDLGNALALGPNGPMRWLLEFRPIPDSVRHLHQSRIGA